MNDDLEKAEVDRINIFHKFVKARLDTIDQVAVEKEVLGEANRLEVQNKAPIILCELLLENEDATVLKAIKKHKRLFLR